MAVDPIARRDAGLHRISKVTRRAAALGVLLTGGLSALAAQSFSGTSTAATQTNATTQSTTQSTTPSTTSPKTQSTTNTTVAQLQSPSYSIRSSSGSGRVSSGGS
jgi:hypothetical protein